MKAILVHQPGGPERMRFEEAAKPSAGPGEALVRVEAAGVNFIDVYFRTGLYKGGFPLRLGMEGAGTVEEVGEGVTEFRPGDRVVYTMNRGSYAEYHAVSASQLIRLPDAVDFHKAAACMLQGMTAHYLTHSTFPLAPGQTALVHAAAGGTGALIVQMARMRGARVIGTAGNAEKTAIAMEAGAAFAINYSEQDFEEEVRRVTAGAGVDVVYDSVGAATFQKSLNCLRPRGMMVSFGNSSGAVPPMEPLLLSQKGSLFLTRPSLGHYCAKREELLWRAGDVLGWVASGALKIRIDKIYPMAEAAEAHRCLEGRKTTGKLLLLPR